MTATPRRLLALSGVLLMVTSGLVGCGLLGKQGEGPVQTETRNVLPFTRVETGGGIRVDISIGPKQSVTVGAQANILPIIGTDVVSSDTLRIFSTEGYTTSAGVRVTIVMPTLEGVTLSGGSPATAQDVVTDSLDVAVSGGATFTAAGTATILSVNASGGARADLQGLAAKTAMVNASGGSNVTVRASDAVEGDASGGAHVTVVGGATLNVTTSGGGSVSRQ